MRGRLRGEHTQDPSVRGCGWAWCLVGDNGHLYGRCGYPDEGHTVPHMEVYSLVDSFSELIPVYRARRCDVYSDHANAVRYMADGINSSGSKYATLYRMLTTNMPATWRVHKVPAHATADKLYQHAHLPMKAFIGNAVADAMAKAAAAQAYPAAAAEVVNREREVEGTDRPCRRCLHAVARGTSDQHTGGPQTSTCTPTSGGIA